jgi:hypothetical protein
MWRDGQVVGQVATRFDPATQQPMIRKMYNMIFAAGDSANRPERQRRASCAHSPEVAGFKSCPHYQVFRSKAPSDQGRGLLRVVCQRICKRAPVMRPCPRPRRPPRPMIKAAPKRKIGIRPGPAGGPYSGRIRLFEDDQGLPDAGWGYAVPRLGSIAAARAMLDELADTSQHVILGTNRDATVSRHCCAVPLGGPQYLADRCGASAGPGWQPLEAGQR